MRIFQSLICSFMLFFSSFLHAAALPELGDPSEHALSSSELKKQSQVFKKALVQSGQWITDPLAQSYLDQLTTRLLRHANVHATHFEFFLINDVEINAFAGATGLVGVNSALILQCENESELAAVLAHEISHVTQYHMLRAIDHNKSMRIPMVLGSLAAIAAGTVSPALGSGAIAAGMTGMAEDEIAFTRANEKEADRVGMALLHEADWDPNGMIQFFKRLQQNERLYGSENIPVILRTHPVTSDRIADASNRADQFAKKHYQNSLQFSLFKERIRVLCAQSNAALLDYYGRISSKNIAQRYGYALALAANQNAHEAQHILESLLQTDRNNTFYRFSSATIAADHQQFAQASDLMKPLYLQHPDDILIATRYGEILLEAGNAKAAASILRELSYDHRDNSQILRTLARAQAQSGDKAEAYFSQAEAARIDGSKALAKRLFQSALTLSSDNSLLRLQINDKLAQLNS